MLAPVLAAPFVGSFLGVLIRRLPAGRPVAAARSECESCGRPLGVRDLVPVASFVLLRGRCRTCHAPIAPFHLAVELLATALAAATVGTTALAAAGPGWAWAGCALAWALLALGWIDIGHMRLPDVLTLPLLGGGLLATALLVPEALPAHAGGAAAGYAAFRGVALLYRALRGREGLGRGDAKLLAASGAWLGWQALPDVVLIAALGGLLAAAALRLRGRAVGGTTALPFGPFLALGTWAAWLGGLLLG
jgi:leader peptidase (prepilin peptidase) / N-methyltransferase